MPEEKKSELDQFMGDIKGDEHAVNPFNETPIEEVQKPEDVEEEVESPRNRRERRLASQLESEKRANIELAARLSERSEMEKFRTETGADKLDEDLARIYGTDSPQAKEATRILQAAFDRFEKRAEEKAVDRYQQLQEDSVREQREAEATIDSELDGLEEQFDVDLTSNSPRARKMRNDLLTLVERISPKDEDGNVKEYADFTEAYQLLQSTREKADPRAKDLASRGMAKSGTSMPSKLEANSTEAFLRDNGII